MIEEDLGIIHCVVGNEYFCDLYFTSNGVIAAKTGRCGFGTDSAENKILGPGPLIAPILAKKKSKAL